MYSRLPEKLSLRPKKESFILTLPETNFVPADDFNRLLGSTNRVQYLREDSKGNVWYVTDQETGMLIVNDFGLKKEVRKTVFPELVGRLVGGFEFLYPIDEQNVLIGTEQGFIHYAVDHIPSGDTLLQVTLSTVTAGGSADSSFRRLLPGQCISGI